MNTILESILEEIERDGGIFTAENRLTTRYFVIFLLFGCSDEQAFVLEARAKHLIVEHQSFSIIRVDSADAKEMTNQIDEVIRQASIAQNVVDNLDEVHICPVIFSEKADPSSYLDTVNTATKHLRNRDIWPIWKPFLLLDTSFASAAAWLDAVAESIRAFGSMYSSRCCVLTRLDENGFEVAEERLLTTVLFISFLNVVKETLEEIGWRISFQESAPDQLFYSAQTAFIENPAVTRIFKRMSSLLDRLCERKPDIKALDTSFIHGILNIICDNMPHEGEYISLLPLYSVMPGSGSEFRERLEHFAEKHYLGFVHKGSIRNTVMERLRPEFLSALMKTGRRRGDFDALTGNINQIRDEFMSQSHGIKLAPELDEYPGRGKSSNDATEEFKRFEMRLRNDIANLGRILLDEFFSSDEYSSLLKQCILVLENLDEADVEMKQIIRRRSILDIDLPLLNDPDENWLNNIVGNRETEESFIQCFCDMALIKNTEAQSNELLKLLRQLYKQSRFYAGGSEARSYMKLVSDTCVDGGSDAAKECVAKIKVALRLPIRVLGIGEHDDCTYVWGREDNNLCKVLRDTEIINTRSLSLPITTDERFAVLRISAPFIRSDIQRVQGGEN
ncbi:MAG: hypothetical protein LBH09_05460 [Peptococcaceae bacterium]|jgi:hypothetical protein|nr:hypothetical protein [Peptococcaceae bacterium]